MTLIEEIDESIRLGNIYGNSINLKELLSDAKVLLKKIRSSESDILDLFNTTRNMKNVGLASGDEVKAALDMLKEIYIDVSEKDDYKSNKFGLLVKDINKEHENLTQSWNRYLNREVETQRSIVDTLHILVEDSQRYKTLSSIYNDIKGNVHPGSQDVIEKIKTYRTLTDKMIKELNLQKSVLRFFEKLSSRNVLSLSEMTPEIWNWIHQHGFEDKFTIKISSNKT